ncbi:MAG: carbon-nitrogen hydrolase family protein [Saprospiraceae bacterium]|nr:carbon-nitrogen hydrolase family protein [Saprospiraceae bacterium]
MKICIAQTQSEKGNIEKNIQNHLKMIEYSISLSADLIVFPELSITNYEPDLAKELAISIKDSILDPFQKLADKNQISIGIGMPTPSDSNPKISLLIFQPQQERIVYSKQLLHVDELPYFVSGTEQVYLTIGQHKIAFAICYESLQKEHFIHAHQNGAKLYIASVAKPQTGLEKAYEYFPKIAQEFNTPILLTNSLGFCDNFMSVGQSAVWDKYGKLLGQLNSQQQGLLIYDVELANVEMYQFQSKNLDIK